MPIGLKEVVLVTEVPRCQCQECGKSFDVSPLLPRPTRTTVSPSQRFVCQLSHWMTLSEVAAVSHLGWDTVKEIVKSDLGRRYRRIPLRHVRSLAVEEFHVGRKGCFMTVVIDLESGQILWVAKGRGSDALRKFFRRLRLARAKVKAVACERECRLLERGAPIFAGSRCGVRPFSHHQTGQ